MYCRVCGDERNVSYRPRSRQSLCDSCASDTPHKVSRSAFDTEYWHDDPTVCESTKREFYSDYLSSTHTLAQYIAATVNEVMA